VNLTEQLAQLAQDIETNDPIDWGMLNVDEKSAYMLMAAGVLENYLSLPAEDRDMILLATAVKLTVENFVLNLKLLDRK
jgi:hypothetical protein